MTGLRWACSRASRATGGTDPPPPSVRPLTLLETARGPSVPRLQKRGQRYDGSTVQ